jgi:phage terminase small subunit
MPALPNERHEIFALHIAKGWSRTKAAIEAGWKATTATGVGSRLARTPEVEARVQELRVLLDEERTKAVLASELPTREFVLKELCATYSQAKHEQNVMGQYRGLELIGKELGMFVTRVDARVESPLAGLSAAALLALQAALAEAVTGDAGGRPVLEGEAVEAEAA